MPVIPALQGWGQPDQRVQIRVGYVKPCLKEAKNNGNNHSLLVVFSENKNKKILEIYKLLLCKYN